MLEGAPVARAIIESLRGDLAAFVTQAGRVPNLAAVLVGDDPGSRAYLRAIKRSFQRAGLDVRAEELPPTIDEDAFRLAICALNEDDAVDGIIVLQPLPPHLPRGLTSEVIDPTKDVDGITAVNAGRLAVGQPGFVPSTPAGGMEILRYYDIAIEGQRAVVLGRSNVVGKPMALLLLGANATVTICHSRTQDL